MAIDTLRARPDQPVVLVTGCTKGGIGYSVANELLSRGCRVYASARRLEAMDGLQEAGATLLQLDVVSKESCEAAVRSILQIEERIDILVNNAGVGGTGPLLEFDVEAANRVFLANTFAPLRLAQLVSESMIKKRQGIIVNIGSVVGEIPTCWAGIYAASKAALHSLSRTLEMEVKGFGIEVMIVAAGGVKSGFGGSQLRSYEPSEDSVYKNLSQAILDRANAGQALAIPSELLAKRVVDQILNKPLMKRPSYYSTGGRSWLFAVMRWMPWWIQRFVLMRFGQCHKVGKD